MIEYPKTRSIKDTVYTGTWTDKHIPVYTATSANGLNQLVGYIKHINAANGTVLYRGQCNLHPSVIPSIRRNSKELESKAQILNSILSKMSSDKGILDFWDFHVPEIEGWSLFKKITIEATLQHYGAETFCVDFVDNHWTALWFGLYHWDKTSSSYHERDSSKKADEDKYIDWNVDIDPILSHPLEPTPSTVNDIAPKRLQILSDQAKASGKDISKIIEYELQKINHNNFQAWTNDCAKIDAKNAIRRAKQESFETDNHIGHMYLFLYVAETNVPVLHGVYFGTKTYTVDLRKALPSTFLRPCSQHGWVVKGKDRDYCYDNNIACVIRMNVDLVRELLGKGVLVREENFFPSATYDLGYKVLLQRQEDTPYPETKDYPKLLPSKTISCNF